MQVHVLNATNTTSPAAIRPDPLGTSNCVQRSYRFHFSAFPPCMRNQTISLLKSQPADFAKAY